MCVHRKCLYLNLIILCVSFLRCDACCKRILQSKRLLNLPNYKFHTTFLFFYKSSFIKLIKLIIIVFFFYSSLYISDMSFINKFWINIISSFANEFFFLFPNYVLWFFFFGENLYRWCTLAGGIISPNSQSSWTQ